MTAIPPAHGAWRFRILVPLLTTLVLLGLLEGGARLALRGFPSPASGVRFETSDVWPHGRHSLHEPDPELFWRPTPGRRWRGFEINSQGFRGPEFAPTRASGVRRLVCLGNSVTFGWGVPAESSFVGRLRRQLDAGGESPATEVVNAGVIGYSSWQGRLLCEQRAGALEPDLLLVMYGYNDHHSAQQSDRESYDRRRIRGLLGFVQRTGIFRLVQRMRGVAAPQLRRAPVARVSPEEFRENLLAIRESAAAIGCRTLLMTVPLRPGVPLVENFAAIDFADQRVWMRQVDFAVGSLPAAAGAAVTAHLFQGEDLRGLRADSAACATVLELSRRHPDLPIFHYLHAHCLRDAGQAAAAAAALVRSRSCDRERQELEAYNELLRELAAAGRIELIDLARALADRAATTDARADSAAGDAGLWIDVVHPTAQGHALIAALIAAELTSRAAVR